MGSVIDKDTQFWDRQAEKYNRSPIADEDVYQHKVRLTQAFLSADMDVLEIGCGTGSTAMLHAPFVRHILATDISENMLRIAREKAASAGVSNISFRQADIDTLGVPAASFDMVLALNLLHLCREPLSVMTKIHALLKPGGYFVQSTACLKDFNSLLKLAIPVMQMFGKAPFVKHFSSEELLTMLDTAGFHVVKEYYPGGKSADFIIARRAPD